MAAWSRMARVSLYASVRAVRDSSCGDNWDHHPVRCLPVAPEAAPVAVSANPSL